MGAAPRNHRRPVPAGALLEPGPTPQHGAGAGHRRAPGRGGSNGRAVHDRGHPCPRRTPPHVGPRPHDRPPPPPPRQHPATSRTRHGSTPTNTGDRRGGRRPRRARARGGPGRDRQDQHPRRRRCRSRTARAGGVRGRPLKPGRPQPRWRDRHGDGFGRQAALRTHPTRSRPRPGVGAAGRGDAHRGRGRHAGHR